MDLVQPGILAGSCRPLIFLYIGASRFFFFSFIAISKLIIKFSSTSCIKIRAIAILSKSFLLIRSVLRDWTQKFAILISFSVPRVGKSSFSTYFPCRLIQIRNWNQNLLLKRFQMRAWESITYQIPLSSFCWPNQFSKCQSIRFPAYPVIILWLFIFIFPNQCIGLTKTYPSLWGGQNESKPKDCSKKHRPNRKFC